MIEYNIFTTPFTAPGEVMVDRKCNGFVIKNAGTTLVETFGEQLQPGESKSIGGNYGELFVGRVDIKFTVQAVPPAVITNLAIVTQKVYVKRTFL